MTGTINTDPDQTAVIREIVPGVTTVSIPFLRYNRIKFGGRATIVKLQSGSLAVFSPTPLTPVVKSAISKISSAPVSYLIASDIEHHMNLSAWYSAYPNAHVIGPEGLAEKRAEANKSDKSVTIVPFGTVFTAKDKLSIKISEEFDREFEYEYVEAHPNKEIVFHHKPSKTLIEADWLFNLPATEQYSKTGINPTTGWATKLFSAIGNTKGTAAWQKRAQWYIFSKGDRKSYSESARRVNTWDFVNLVPCHGDVLLGDGKSVFQKVFAWHLEGKH